MAQTIIEMEEQGGVYRIPCLVNGAKMKLIFDTGASTVCLSQSIAEYLLDNDYISSDDFIEAGQSVVADGRIVDHLKINIREIVLGGVRLHNIPAVVVFEQSAPLLLGQSAIQQLGDITISNNKLIIFSFNDTLSEAEIDRLDQESSDAYKNEYYDLAIDKLLQIKDAVGLSAFGLHRLVFCFYSIRDFASGIKYGKEWLNTYENDEQNKPFLRSIYGLMGDLYRYQEDYRNSCLYMQKYMAITSDVSPIDYDSYAQALANTGRYYEADKQWKLAEKTRLKELHKTFKDVLEGRVHDELLSLLYEVHRIYAEENNDNWAYSYRGFSALCGHSENIKWFKDRGKSLNLFKEHFLK
ncbi:MAG: retroviral-like aspartic protease family protein [Muribaculaceae bacterium]|nr:retroviral-like aspartic protease family protein [Muribaculaceae bacterium]